MVAYYGWLINSNNIQVFTHGAVSSVVVDVCRLDGRSAGVAGAKRILADAATSYPSGGPQAFYLHGGEAGKIQACPPLFFLRLQIFWPGFVARPPASLWRRFVPWLPSKPTGCGHLTSESVAFATRLTPGLRFAAPRIYIGEQPLRYRYNIQQLSVSSDIGRRFRLAEPPPWNLSRSVLQCTPRLYHGTV